MHRFYSAVMQKGRNVSSAPLSFRFRIPTSCFMRSAYLRSRNSELGITLQARWTPLLLSLALLDVDEIIWIVWMHRNSMCHTCDTVSTTNLITKKPAWSGFCWAFPQCWYSGLQYWIVSLRLSKLLWVLRPGVSTLHVSGHGQWGTRKIHLPSCYGIIVMDN